ncbi:hypothetical protein EUA07_18690 [Nocardioides ganghwensis]|uniref:Uncharacterized protein n=1 Tax=Nocardioides ganghwensis TaxID=252230 RepID=A0A4Q2S8D2_9ACTN|nr:hypothetical protein EUA07_18690 [Nocardioides ganghwensis]
MQVGWSEVVARCGRRRPWARGPREQRHQSGPGAGDPEQGDRRSGEHGQAEAEHLHRLVVVPVARGGPRGSLRELLVDRGRRVRRVCAVGGMGRGGPLRGGRRECGRPGGAGMRGQPVHGEDRQQGSRSPPGPGHGPQPRSTCA